MQVTIPKSCIICNRSFGWHEAIIVKLPEGVPMCLSCSPKYRDETVYEGIEGWAAIEYEPDTTFIYDSPLKTFIEKSDTL